MSECDGPLDPGPGNHSHCTMINETVGFVSLLHEHVTSVTVSAFTHCIDPMVFLQLHPARMSPSL